MKFQDIVREAEKTAHLVYGLAVTVPCITRHKTRTDLFRTTVYKAPRPKRVNKAKLLRQLQNEERKERAAQIAALVGDNIAVCENANADLSSLIDPPKHIKLADKDLPVTIALILNK